MRNGFRIAALIGLSVGAIVAGGCADSSSYTTWLNAGQSLDVSVFGGSSNLTVENHGPGAMRRTVLVRTETLHELGGLGPGDRASHGLAHDESLMLIDSTGCEITVRAKGTGGLTYQLRQAE